MKHLVLAGLLAVGLVGCGLHLIEGPNGCQVTGPIIEGHSLTYTVTGFQPQDDTMRQFLTSLAYGSVAGAEEEGTYTINFVDKRTGGAIWSKRGHVVIDELDKRHKVSLD